MRPMKLAKVFRVAVPSALAQCNRVDGWRQSVEKLAFLCLIVTTIVVLAQLSAVVKPPQ
jgi:hypothetical protein